MRLALRTVGCGTYQNDEFPVEPWALTDLDPWTEVGGWTPEICCSAPGAKGNPLCWDSVANSINQDLI